jgi:hypothetical protein
VSDRTPQQAYVDLQKLARTQGRGTQQLFELYIHERFLARLAESQFAEQFVLKGGMLLAVLDVRRATRDADMLARDVASDDENLRAVVGEITAIAMSDGVSFRADGMSIVPIREAADYPGVRLTLPASLGGAQLKLKVDLSFGDPVVPTRISYPTLLDDASFGLLGYPLESVIAEKAETMMFLGDANTRDRDFGDVYMLSEIHPIEAQPLRSAIRTVAEHRGREVRALGPLLQTLRETRQQPWEAFRARVALLALPERFADVVDRVVDFLDDIPPSGAARWSPLRGRWE